MLRRRRVRRRTALLILLAIPVAAVVWISVAMQPLIRELAEATVQNQGQNVINAAIEELLENEQIDYDHIIFLEKT